MSENAIQKAVRLAGGQSALARAIGVTQGAVWKWLNNHQKISPQNAVAISMATNGEVKPYELRPDIPTVFPRPSGDI
ncbi:TPA: transcriptional regulator [Citrobacter freundii]|uniref:Helix-turn-helix domain-containing protein n=1 Tax=Enterobacter cloacae TaxID=550 RepID=A0A2T4XW79_ENTCL|nr:MULTISPECIES: helix-turn-helix domain-containing protein [Enterobacteriaceae]EDG5032415.1 helix-turn-helix domain-containing protein [Salmonella enterica subsp. enterica serovar Bovismorbificans]HAL1461076.1 helix-turn-helix domain-containing protein [Escherichia coli]EAW5735679.1 helix-turn-helix domain-containing protein [Salmonella enterica]EEO7693591.1 helix-turn-helix domain-containing protein [Salmonella enterica subsp. enterica serovar Bovismorbificans]EJD3719745.1 helix-turn-helix d